MPTEDQTLSSDRNLHIPHAGGAREFFRYFIKAAFWALLIYLAATHFATSHMWIVVLSVFVFSVPIAISSIYRTTVEQIRRLEGFARQGWIFRLFSGRTLKVVVWVVVSLVIAFFMLIQFHTYNLIEWGIFFLVIPLFWIVFQFCQGILASEYKPYLATSKALTWARGFSAFLMLLIYVIASLIWVETPVYDSLQDAIDAQQIAVQNMTGSFLVMEVSRALAFYDGVKDYALGRLGEQESLSALLLMGIGVFIVFYHACAMLTCFLLPAREYRRIFGPLTTLDQPGPVPVARVAITVAIITFLALFVYVPLFSQLEAVMRNSPQLAATAQNVQSWVIPKLEQIDSEYFQVGTIEKLDQARTSALRSVEVSLLAVETQADLAFNSLEPNVDLYLDWYYSLGGEYTRIASMMTGQIEEYMAAKLQESLLQGDAFSAIEQALNQLLIEHQEAQQIYQESAQRIMRENMVAAEAPEIDVVQQMSLADVMSPPVHQDLIGLQSRLIGSSAAGALAGAASAVVVQKIIAKVMGKNIFKLSATALSKLLVSKAAGSAAGAAVGAGSGALAGSVVPGIGTAIGAVIGGIAGAIGIGITIDKVIIEIDELVNREEFRQEILLSIEDARQEFKASLRGL